MNKQVRRKVECKERIKDEFNPRKEHEREVEAKKNPLGKIKALIYQVILSVFWGGGSNIHAFI